MGSLSLIQPAASSFDQFDDERVYALSRGVLCKVCEHRGSFLTRALVPVSQANLLCGFGIHDKITSSSLFCASFGALPYTQTRAPSKAVVKPLSLLFANVDTTQKNHGRLGSALSLCVAMPYLQSRKESSDWHVETACVRAV